MKKRIVSVLLLLSLCIALFSATASADETWSFSSEEDSGDKALSDSSLSDGLTFSFDDLTDLNGQNVQNSPGGQDIQNAPVSACPSDVTVSTDKSSYQPEETITVSVSGTDMNWFSVEVKDEGGNTVYSGDSMTSGVTFSLNAPGNYFVTAVAYNTAENYTSANCEFVVSQAETNSDTGLNETAPMLTEGSSIGSYGVDLSSDGYKAGINPFAQGECTWYVWGRAYEKLGIELPWRGDATDWTANASAAGYSTGTEARANCIMVEHYSPGHVFFVESVEDGYAYVSEGNYLGSYHEDAINLSTMRRDSWQSHEMGEIDFIYLNSITPPSNIKVSTNKKTYQPGETITLNVSANNMNWYVVTIKDESGTYVYENWDQNTSPIQFSLPEGKYDVTVSACNTWECYADGHCSFTVSKNAEPTAPTNVRVSTDKETYTPNEDIVVSFSAEGDVQWYEIRAFTFDENEKMVATGLDLTSSPLTISIKKPGNYRINAIAYRNETLHNSADCYISVSDTPEPQSPANVRVNTEKDYYLPNEEVEITVTGDNINWYTVKIEDGKNQIVYTNNEHNTTPITFSTETLGPYLITVHAFNTEELSAASCGAFCISSIPEDVTFTPWTKEGSTYIRETDASLGVEVAVRTNSSSEVGMELYDKDGNFLGKAGVKPGDTTRDNPPNISWVSRADGNIYNAYFKINEMLGVTLSPGTTYKCRFYAIVNGETKWSAYGSFQTKAAPDSFYLDLNGYCGGEKSDIRGYGTVDVYINGTRAADDCTDFYAAYPAGTRYEFKDIQAADGFRYVGVRSGALSGTIENGNVSVVLEFSELPPVPPFVLKFIYGNYSVFDGKNPLYFVINDTEDNFKGITVDGYALVNGVQYYETISPDGHTLIALNPVFLNMLSGGNYHIIQAFTVNGTAAGYFRTYSVSYNINGVKTGDDSPAEWYAALCLASILTVSAILILKRKEIFGRKTR